VGIFSPAQTFNGNQIRWAGGGVYYLEYKVRYIMILMFIFRIYLFPPTRRQLTISLKLQITNFRLKV